MLKTVSTRHCLRTDEPWLGTLTMVGMSLPGRLGAGLGPEMRYGHPDQLRMLKCTRSRQAAFLTKLRESGLFEEVWIFSTCNRFEVYGFSERNQQRFNPKTMIAEVCSHLEYPLDGAGNPFNVLTGRPAVHHLLRTIFGLNSPLPGEQEVEGQFYGAIDLARSAGIGGRQVESLLNVLRDVGQKVRRSPCNRLFATSYGEATFRRLRQIVGVDFQNCRISLVGGSGTTLSALTSLRRDFAVPACNLTIVHRGNRRTGRYKQIRRLLGDGRSLRVESYRDVVSLSAILNADVVILGIEQPDPILRNGDFQSCSQQFRPDRPIINHRLIVDFNTLGSTESLDGVPGLVLWNAAQIQDQVRCYADQFCRRPEFGRHIMQVEMMLADLVEQILPD